MKYEKPKIEFIKIENRDNIAELSNGGTGSGKSTGWSNFVSGGDA